MANRISKLARTIEPTFPFCHLVLKAPMPQYPRYPRVVSIIGDRIRTRRLDLGLRQTDFAKRIGVRVQAVVAWESNRSAPGIMNIERANAFLKDK